MRAEVLSHRWAALLLGATLLTTGCVTLAPRPGGSGQRVRLVYEGGTLLPNDIKALEVVVRRAEHKVPGVGVSFQ